MPTLRTLPATGRPAAASRFPPAMPAIAVAIFLLGGSGPNAGLAAFAIAVLLAGSLLLWRPGEPPILLLVFALPWLQASAKIFHANWLGLELDALMTFGGNVHLATVLSLIALLALACGMRLAVGAPRTSLSSEKADFRLHMSWLMLYVLSAIAALIAQRLASRLPGLTQPLLALQTIKWACFWALTYETFSERETSRLAWLAVFTIELTLSLGDYFSEFKTVLIITLLALMTSGIRLSLGRWMGLTAVALLLAAMTLVWTAIKVDYRDFVSGGERTQSVTVAFGERIARITDLTTALDTHALFAARDRLLERIAYVDYFAAVTHMVPEHMPYERGAIWLDALTRPFMPRLLFPDKTIIDDSSRTNHYTGLGVYGADEGTSISIGYLGESYIDFGPIGMMVAVLLFGAVLGWIYRWLSTIRGVPKPLAMGLATAVLYQVAFLDSSITKTIGGLAVTLIVSWMVTRVISRLPRYPSTVG